MIYLAITPIGFATARRAAGESDAVWCGSAAVSDEDFAQMDDKSFRFIHSFVGDDAAGDLESATRTISEHHPGQTIWIEAPAQA